jgi:hypothetical protein
VPSEFENLRKSLEKLRLNDSSFTFEPETSDALGFGFRCGFLGLLHMEVIQQRLEREEDMDLVQTAPTVRYRVKLTNGEIKEDPFAERTARRLGDRGVPRADHARERRRARRVHRRGDEDLHRPPRPVREDRLLRSRARDDRLPIPFAEIIFDFHDHLKSATRGYGTMDYEVEGFEASNLVKVRILVAGDEVDALSFLCHKDQSREPRPQDPEAAAQGDPAPPVRSRAAGRDRRQDHRARVDRGRCARTSPPSATAATSAASASCSRSRRKARSACAGRQRRDPAEGVPVGAAHR